MDMHTKAELWAQWNVR